MDQVINSCLTAFNSIGRGFCGYTAGIFVQSSVLIVLLLIIDFLLRKRVRAVFRYCVWMLVFVKLILPPTLSLPTGIGYWYGDYLSADLPVLQQVSNMVRPEPAIAPAPEDFALSAEIAQDQPSQTNPQIAAPVTSAVSGLNAIAWQAVVFGLWLVGVLVISVLLVQRMLFVRGLVAQSEPAKNRLPDMLNQCRRQVGIRRNIELRLTNNISGPAVCGLFKPVILIPTALVEKLSPDKLRAVLIHELVHIKRADIWVNLVQTVLQIIYFYNPFVWLANAVVRRIREQAVDEMVLVALGAGAKSYSNTLIDIAEMAFFRTSMSLRLIGVVESKKALHRRIKLMLNRPIPKNAKLGVLGLVVVIIIGAILLPMAKAQKQSVGKTPVALDLDEDGLENRLEAELGTNPKKSDTDGDGLSDYDEYCKYRTDPTKIDSDGDGKSDGDWQERREYAYTIRAICEIRSPSNMEMINDLYQDARPFEKKAALKDARVVEVLIFPFAKAHIYSQPYPKKNLDKKLKEYIKPTVSMNYSPEMKEQINNIVEGSATDVAAIEKMLQWMNRETELVRELPHWEFFHVIDGKIVWHKSIGSPARNEQFLETNFLGDSMFKKKVHGTCSSTAILRGTIFRAAGLPTRLVQTLPLITRYSEDPEPLADRLRMREMAKGYTWGPGSGGANHTYNEVFLNNRWVRVNNSISTGPFVGDKLFVKAWSSADWNNLKEEWNSKRCFRALDVSDAHPKYKTESTKIDIAIDDKNLTVTKQPDGLFKARIVIYNKGSYPLPRFGVNFYAGDPDKGGRLLATHAAGPIMPGGGWGEYNPRLKLRPGENTISVVVDPGNKVEESDETNNKASKAISTTVDKDNSQPSDRPSTLASKPPQLQTRTSEFVAILSNGVTVELLGVCEHPSEGKQWWRPDGSLIDKAPYKTMGSRLKRDKGYNYYEFVLRLKGPRDTSYKWQIPSGKHSTDTGAPIDENGDRVSDLRVYTTNQAEDKTTALVRIGLSADKWQTLASHPVNIPEKTYTLEDGENAVAFGRAYEKEGQTIVPLAHTLNRDLGKKALRLIAVTKNGEEIRGSVWRSGGNILSSNTYGFDLSLQNIKEFRFQTRSYHWVEFKNVSLRPGHKTDVQF